MANLYALEVEQFSAALYKVFRAFPGVCKREVLDANMVH